MALFLLLFQIVMVVDARDPLFYRCPDLEVTLSLSLSLSANLQLSLNRVFIDPPIIYRHMHEKLMSIKKQCFL